MTRVLHFQPDRILISRAEEYLNNPGLILNDRERGINCLLKAIRLVDPDMRRKIVVLLGSLGSEDVIDPLYEILIDPDEPDELREEAAININVLGPFLRSPGPRTEKLIRLVEHGCHEERALAIVALGWEGNHAAVDTLCRCLDDSSEEIQELSVFSLCSIGESSMLDILAERLESASLDQRRAILYSIWRFRDRALDVERIYRRELEDGDRRLKTDVLIVFGELEKRVNHSDIYLDYLHDADSRIRAIALERLGSVGGISTDTAISFLEDPSMEVKRAAIHILQMKKDEKKI